MRGFGISVSTAAVLLVGAAPPAEASVQVRGMQALGRRLIADGVQRSPTIRRLVAALESSDVIVYVDVRRDLPSSVGGSMRFVAATTTHRVVGIALNREQTWPTLLAYLGHELQHATEVAEAPQIVNHETFRAWYREFGIHLDRHAYDSHAARMVTQTVAAELRGRRREVERVARLDDRTF